MSQFSLLTHRQFAPLFATQFLGAFNDNVYKNAVVIFIVFHLAATPSEAALLSTVSAGLFIFVGQLVDRFYTRNIKYLRGLAGTLPIASTLFLLLTFANISVPGSFNFIAEILILMGAFTTNTWVASVAATAVLLGATYSL